MKKYSLVILASLVVVAGSVKISFFSGESDGKCQWKGIADLFGGDGREEGGVVI